MGFTLQPITSQIAPVTATALTKFYQAKSVGIIYDSTQNYTTSTSAAVKTLLEAAGVQVTSYQPIAPGAPNYTEVLAWTPSSPTWSIRLSTTRKVPRSRRRSRRARAAPTTIVVCSTTRRMTTDTSKKRVRWHQGAPLSAYRHPAISRDRLRRLPRSSRNSASHQERGARTPFDSLNFLVDGAKQVGSFDSAALTSFLSKVAGWNGWTGSVTIEAKTGNREPATVVVTAVTNGEFHVDSAWATAVGAPY